MKIIFKIFLIIAILVVIIVSAINIKKYQFKQEIESDHKEIKKILDEALLSNEPIIKLNEAIPKINKYSTVDSVWFSGLTIFVKYKKGGLVSWSISPENLNKEKE